MKQTGWIFFSGFLWLAIGVFLLYKGLNFVSEATLATDSLSFRFQGLFGSPGQAGTGIIAIGLMIGFAKGRLVLSKTVDRVVKRIRSLQVPIRASQIYARSYWILIGSMVALGFAMRFLPIPLDARGLIDVAIGSALVNGAMLYFRAARLNP
jgi:hypothetical protein